MNRTLGVVVLVIGLVVLFGGLGWTYKQYQDEKDNNQDTPGPFTNPDETDENASSGMNALWVAAAGFVVAVVGVVLLVMGGRSRATA